MDHLSDHWWARVESIRYRLKMICVAADKAEAASIDAEMAELRDFVWALLRAREESSSTDSPQTGPALP